MAPGRPPSIDQEADRFEIALKTARIPEKLHNSLWDVWVDDPPRAHHLIVRFKEYPQSMRLKASDPIDVAFQQLRKAHASGDTGQINAALQQLGTLVLPATGTVGTHLSDTQKPATKAAELRPFEHIGRATMPELYGEKGPKR